MNYASMAAATALLWAGVGQAQDLEVTTGFGLQSYPEYDGPNTATRIDVNGYLEVERSGFYLGTFGELSTQSDDHKLDIYGGYKGDTDFGLSYDVSLQRRFYLNAGGDYSTIELDLDYDITDKLSTSLALSYYPDVSSTKDAYVGISYDLTDKLSVSANYGIYEVEDASSEEEWDFGTGYALGDETAFDLRYYNGTEYVASYFGVSFKWDTTLLSR